VPLYHPDLDRPGMIRPGPAAFRASVRKRLIRADPAAAIGQVNHPQRLVDEAFAGSPVTSVTGQLAGPYGIGHPVRCPAGQMRCPTRNPRQPDRAVPAAAVGRLGGDWPLQLVDGPGHAAERRLGRTHHRRVAVWRFPAGAPRSCHPQSAVTPLWIAAAITRP